MDTVGDFPLFFIFFQKRAKGCSSFVVYKDVRLTLWEELAASKQNKENGVPSESFHKHF